MIEVVLAGTLNTVQDIGRGGQRKFGIGSSGAMDAMALRLGNILLGNDDGAAGIEIQVFPFAVRFTCAHDFAVTGADCDATLDGMLLPPWWAATARPGQVLRLEAPRAGARSYLTVSGGIEVPVVLGSRSTHLRGAFGGFEGRALRDGDRLAAVQPANNSALALGIEAPFRQGDDTISVRAIPAADHDDFPIATREVFWSSVWRISAQSNRHGYRLLGPALEGAGRFDLRSSPIVPGVIQIPPSGQPIIQMSDANSAGGYPKMATVIVADLPSLGQAKLGSHCHLVRVDGGVAAAAHREQVAYLARARRLAGLWRRSLAAAQ